MKFKPLTIVFILFFIYSTVHGQIRFSQTSSSALLNNPANTGRFNRDYRLGVAFRSEKNAQNDLQEHAFMFCDVKIFKNIIPENDCFGFGILGLTEKIKTEGIKNSQVSLSLSYQKALDEDGLQKIGVGFQTSFVQRRLERPNLIYESQLESWINSGYSVNFFDFNNVNFSYIDLSVGLIYQGKIGKNCSFLTGLAVNHVTSPSIAFQGGEFNLMRQYTANFSMEKQLLGGNKIFFSGILRNHSKFSNDFLVGLDYQIKLKNTTSMVFGSWLKNSSSRGFFITPAIGVYIGLIRINLTYDVNLSSKPTSLRSASEMSLLYTNAFSRDGFLEDRFTRF